MTDLVFLLYELPPPLGKTHERMKDIIGQDNENKSGNAQADRYLVHARKGIIIKKVDALELMRGLKIKVYGNS